MCTRFFIVNTHQHRISCFKFSLWRDLNVLFQEADTDENQGTLTFEEFCVFYKMMSLRRDLYLLLLSYSDKKDHLTVEELAQFLKVEQKVLLDYWVGCLLKNICERCMCVFFLGLDVDIV